MSLAQRLTQSVILIAPGVFNAFTAMLANMVEGGKTPLLPGDELQAIGFRIAIFPGGLARAVARTATDYFASLKGTGSTNAFLDRMLDFRELNQLLGTPDMLALGKRYDGES